ncbi:MAG: SpoIIE family protein phosphatase [bacterium]|nr:SpoIIE family protein phosphatase [bacterium]
MRRLLTLLFFLLLLSFGQTPKIRAADNMCNVDRTCTTSQDWERGWGDARQSENIDKAPTSTETDTSGKEIRKAGESNKVNRSQKAADDAKARGGDRINSSQVTEDGSATGPATAQTSSQAAVAASCPTSFCNYCGGFCANSGGGGCREQAIGKCPDETGTKPAVIGNTCITASGDICGMGLVNGQPMQLYNTWAVKDASGKITSVNYLVNPEQEFPGATLNCIKKVANKCWVSLADPAIQKVVGQIVENISQGTPDKANLAISQNLLDNLAATQVISQAKIKTAAQQAYLANVSVDSLAAKYKLTPEQVDSAKKEFARLTTIQSAITRLSQAASKDSDEYRSVLLSVTKDLSPTDVTLVLNSVANIVDQQTRFTLAQSNDIGKIKSLCHEREGGNPDCDRDDYARLAIISDLPVNQVQAVKDEADRRKQIADAAQQIVDIKSTAQDPVELTTREQTALKNLSSTDQQIARDLASNSIQEYRQLYQKYDLYTTGDSVRLGSDCRAKYPTGSLPSDPCANLSNYAQQYLLPQLPAQLQQQAQSDRSAIQQRLAELKLSQLAANQALIADQAAVTTLTDGGQVISVCSGDTLTTTVTQTITRGSSRGATGTGTRNSNCSFGCSRGACSTPDNDFNGSLADRNRYITSVQTEMAEKNIDQQQAQALVESDSYLPRISPELLAIIPGTSSPLNLSQPASTTGFVSRGRPSIAAIAQAAQNQINEVAQFATSRCGVAPNQNAANLDQSRKDCLGQFDYDQWSAYQDIVETDPTLKFLGLTPQLETDILAGKVDPEVLREQLRKQSNSWSWIGPLPIYNGSLLAANNFFQGTTFRGTALQKEALETGNTWDYVRGTFIAGAPPAAAAVAIAGIAFLPVFPAATASLGTFMQFGSQAFSTYATTQSLANTAEVCSFANNWTTEQKYSCSIAAGNSVYMATSTSLGILSASLNASQVAFQSALPKIGTAANAAGEINVINEARNAVSLGTNAAQSARGAQFINSLSAVNAVAGAYTFGGQAITSCFGANADTLNCATNVGMALASLGRITAISLAQPVFAPTTQTVTKFTSQAGEIADWIDGISSCRKGSNLGECASGVIDAVSGVNLGGASLQTTNVTQNLDTAAAALQSLRTPTGFNESDPAVKQARINLNSAIIAAARQNALVQAALKQSDPLLAAPQAAYQASPNDTTAGQLLLDKYWLDQHNYLTTINPVSGLDRLRFSGPELTNLRISQEELRAAAAAAQNSPEGLNSPQYQQAALKTAVALAQATVATGGSPQLANQIMQTLSTKLNQQQQQLAALQTVSQTNPEFAGSATGQINQLATQVASLQQGLLALAGQAVGVRGLPIAANQSVNLSSGGSFTPNATSLAQIPTGTTTTVGNHTFVWNREANIWYLRSATDAVTDDPTDLPHGTVAEAGNQLYLLDKNDPDFAQWRPIGTTPRVTAAAPTEIRNYLSSLPAGNVIVHKSDGALIGNPGGYSANDLIELRDASGQIQWYRLNPDSGFYAVEKPADIQPVLSPVTLPELITQPVGINGLPISANQSVLLSSGGQFNPQTSNLALLATGTTTTVGNHTFVWNREANIWYLQATTNALPSVSELADLPRGVQTFVNNQVYILNLDALNQPVWQQLTTTSIAVTQPQSDDTQQQVQSLSIGQKTINWVRNLPNSWRTSVAAIPLAGNQLSRLGLPNRPNINQVVSQAQQQVASTQTESGKATQIKEAAEQALVDLQSQAQVPVTDASQAKLALTQAYNAAQVALAEAGQIQDRLKRVDADVVNLIKRQIELAQTPVRPPIPGYTGATAENEGTKYSKRQEPMEDAVGISQNPSPVLKKSLGDVLLIEADGMGAMGLVNSGAIAARIIQSRAGEIYFNELAFSSNQTVDINDRLHQTMIQLNAEIAARNLNGGGATVELVVIEEKGGIQFAHVAHIGDSATWLVRNGVAYSMTKDQSFVGALLDEGQISVQEAGQHPQNNVVFAALMGNPSEDTPAIKVSTFEVKEGDVLISMSDGVLDPLRWHNRIFHNKAEALTSGGAQSGGFFVEAAKQSNAQAVANFVVSNVRNLANQIRPDKVDNITAGVLVIQKPQPAAGVPAQQTASLQNELKAAQAQLNELNLQYRQAQQTADLARQNYQTAKQNYDNSVSTNQKLALAEIALRQAEEAERTADQLAAAAVLKTGALKEWSQSWNKLIALNSKATTGLNLQTASEADIRIDKQLLDQQIVNLESPSSPELEDQGIDTESSTSTPQSALSKISLVLGNSITSTLPIVGSSLSKTRFKVGAIVADTVITSLAKTSIEWALTQPNVSDVVNIEEVNLTATNPDYKPYLEIVKSGVQLYQRGHPNASVTWARKPERYMVSDLAEALTKKISLDESVVISENLQGRYLDNPDIFSGKSALTAIGIIFINNGLKVNKSLIDSKDVLLHRLPQTISKAAQAASNVNTFPREALGNFTYGEFETLLDKTEVWVKQQATVQNGPIGSAEILAHLLNETNGDLERSMYLLSEFFRYESRTVNRRFDPERALWMKDHILDEYSLVLPYNSFASPSEISYSGPFKLPWNNRPTSINYDLSLKNRVGLPYHSANIVALLNRFSPEFITLMTAGEYITYGDQQGFVKAATDIKVIRQLKEIESYLSSFSSP